MIKSPFILSVQLSYHIFIKAYNKIKSFGLVNKLDHNFALGH